MKEIFLYFLRLGCLGFGGPLSVVAQMQREIVTDRKWISPEEYIQTLALIKSMPGPLAFSMATYVGYRRGGFWGGTLAGWGFVLPSALMMILLAMIYDQFAGITWISKSLAGMQAAALALIVISIRSLVVGYERKWIFWLLMAAALALSMASIPEPIVIIGFGLLAILIQQRRQRPLGFLFAFPFIAIDPKVMDLFWICFKSGAVVFGTGLAMVPILESDFVTHMKWITHAQFMNALSFGQMTPGPVLITVTFVGFKVAGFAGATMATLGIFLPSFIHMTTWFPKMAGWLSQQTWIAKFILGALAAVVATLLLTTYKICNVSSVGQNMAMIVFILLCGRWKIPSWLLIVIGAVVGFLFL